MWSTFVHVACGSGRVCVGDGHILTHQRSTSFYIPAAVCASLNKFKSGKKRVYSKSIYTTNIYLSPAPEHWQNSPKLHTFGIHYFRPEENSEDVETYGSFPRAVGGNTDTRRWSTGRAEETPKVSVGVTEMCKGTYKSGFYATKIVSEFIYCTLLRLGCYSMCLDEYFPAEKHLS